MAWVDAENAKTLGVLEKDPRFAGFYADALKIAQAQDRIPAPTFIQSQIFNFWQDQDHVRGIWRRTTLAEYSKASPAWETVLDLDALAKSENANWVWQGAECYWPSQRRCLVHLSDGGEDADTVREFDLTQKQFPSGGFVLPRGKQDVTWENADTLLAAREWSPGEVTTSGYPYIVKRLKRGQPLSGATEVFRGTQSDVGVSPSVMHDGQGHRVVMIVRNMTFFTSEYYLVSSTGTRKLDVPLKADASALVAGRLLFKLRQDWSVNGTTFPQGSLVSLDLAAATADPEHLKPSLVFAPGPRESLDQVTGHAHPSGGDDPGQRARPRVSCTRRSRTAVGPSAVWRCPTTRPFHSGRPINTPSARSST